MNAPRASRTLARQRGAGIVETLIGLFIGLLVVLVVYNLLAVAEGYKRMTTGDADAQITGLMSQFVAGQDAANGGNGLTSAYSRPHQLPRGRSRRHLHGPRGYPEADLGDDHQRRLPRSPTASSRGRARRPTWSGPSPFGRQARVVARRAPTSSCSRRRAYDPPARASLPTAANPHWAVAIANDGTGRCGLIQITNAVPLSRHGHPGEVTPDAGRARNYHQLTPAVPTTTRAPGRTVLSLGRDGDTSRIRYDARNDPAATATRDFD